MDMDDAQVGEAVTIPVDGTRIHGFLNVPDPVIGVVAFAHGSGSGRHSPRNQAVAHVLFRAGLATLLLDLLDETESLDRSKVFDIRLLAARLDAAAAWLTHRNDLRGLALGYFGASTGAAAALVAAAAWPDLIRAVVSRGGRPDLALDALPKVTAPTLLIVGGLDSEVLELNRIAYERLVADKQLVVVPGASHLFEEPGCLEQVAVLSRDWFLRYLTGSS